MKVTIKTNDNVFEVEAGKGARIDDLVLSTGILLDRPCNGKGKCGKCIIKLKGAVSDIKDDEEKALGTSLINGGFRLACQTRVAGDCQIEIDTNAVFTDKTFDTGADLSKVDSDFGLAIDLGTTTAAVFLVGLDDGKVYSGNAELNRQASWGAEVMNRLMSYTDDQEALTGAAWESIVSASSDLIKDKSVCGRVKKAVLVGNSVMHHLCLGLSGESLKYSPFEPESKKPEVISPGPLKKIFPNLEDIYCPPLIGGFVGSDALACLVYFGMGRESETALILDLGTNGEIMLISDGKIFAASTAAGPAFEGVNISCGMRALPGAVTRTIWDADKLSFSTIGGLEPKGLTGSGLISSVKALVNAGAIESSGRIPQSCPGNIQLETVDEIKRIILNDKIYLTQTDIRELQKAKGAVRAAADILLERAGKSANQLDRVVLTGSFGGKLEPKDVLELGVLPECHPGIIHSIPNGAGFGASMMLKEENWQIACEMALMVKHVELNLDPQFMDRYVLSMALE
jgi:uncharacterized 2Fe-2S/4Fe-4S cluster protein (DUF4445 family)